MQWYDRHGRRDLPWQIEPTPYRVWVSEIMLQQTQVSTVIPYFQRFMRRFPDVQTLARADLDDVLQSWAGLGYYARGRNLHRAAGIIVERFDGRFPESPEEVLALPGVGRSTAGAILALARNQRHAILDGNVKRSLCRYHGIDGYPGAAKVEARLWRLAERHTPHTRVADYTQAVMDFGATLCTRSNPGCDRCPQRTDCVACQQDRVAELPAPRPRRQRPLKRCHMLALVDSDANELLLFRRPESGIWGGLYSLPEFDSLDACSARLAPYRKQPALPLSPAAPVRHAFTHFDLEIMPLSCHLPRTEIHRLLDDNRVKALDFGLFRLGEAYRLGLDAPAAAVGLPAPVQRIIESLSSAASDREQPPA